MQFIPFNVLFIDAIYNQIVLWLTKNIMKETLDIEIAFFYNVTLKLTNKTWKIIQICYSKNMLEKGKSRFGQFDVFVIIKILLLT